MKKEDGQNVWPMEKNVETQGTNLGLNEDETGENNPGGLIPPAASPSSQGLEREKRFWVGASLVTT